MKAGMLFVSALTLALTLGSSPAYSGDLGDPSRALAAMSSARVESAKKCYLEALESGNEGVVESTIGIVLQWQLINPKENLYCLEQKINDLALEGPTSAIRFKASLASLVMDNPSLADFDAAACEDCGELFDEITRTVRQMMLGQKLQ